MKIKAPANRPKTKREIGTSTKTRATQRRGETSRGESGRNGKKVPKKDNTKLFIGIGVGAFFFIFVIIAAAAGGGSSKVVDSEESTAAAEKKFNLPVDVRKQIYLEYIQGDNKIEDDAQKQTTSDRAKGADIRNEVDRLKQSLRIELREKWQKKYPEVNSSFIKKVIKEGIDKNWTI